MSPRVSTRLTSRPANDEFLTGLAILAVFIGSACVSVAEAADFHCAVANVQCLVDSINTSNSNGESNTIHLEAGTYLLTRADNPVRTGSGLFGYGNGFPIISGRVVITGVADRTIIERFNQPADNFFRFFEVARSGELTLEHLTFLHGSTGNLLGNAGVILSYGSLHIIDSLMTENFSPLAGAIQIANGTLTLRDSQLVRNGVGIGGDIVSIGNHLGATGPFGPVSAIIERTTIADSFMQEGSALSVLSGASARISETTVARTRLIGVGAGIMAFGVTVISDTTVANLSLGVESAGIWGSANALVVNSTIASNTAGIRGPVRLQNSILTGNVFSGNCIDGGPVSLGHNLIGDPRGCTGLLPSDLITGPHASNPLSALAATLRDAGLGDFVDGGRPGDGHFPLLVGSPAIDVGDPAACPQADQRLLERPLDGNGDGVRGCDIGAVEFYPLVNDRLQLAVVTGTFQRPPADPADVNPRAAGGEFHIDSTFINVGPTNICHVAFEVTTLRANSATVTMLAPNGGPLGQAGVTIPANAIGASRDFAVQGQEHYHFDIGVSSPEAITFLVNIVGEPLAGSCAP